jgi:hypothetical protein
MVTQSGMCGHGCCKCYVSIATRSVCCLKVVCCLCGAPAPRRCRARWREGRLLCPALCAHRCSGTRGGPYCEVGDSLEDLCTTTTSRAPPELTGSSVRSSQPVACAARLQAARPRPRRQARPAPSGCRALLVGTPSGVTGGGTCTVVAHIAREERVLFSHTFFCGGGGEHGQEHG